MKHKQHHAEFEFESASSFPLHHERIPISMNIYIYIYIYMCVCVCVCVYIYIYICVCVCVYIYIYTCVCVSMHVFVGRSYKGSLPLSNKWFFFKENIDRTYQRKFEKYEDRRDVCQKCLDNNYISQWRLNAEVSLRTQPSNSCLISDLHHQTRGNI